MRSILLVGIGDESSDLLGEILAETGWQVHLSHGVEEVKDVVQRGLDYDILVVGQVSPNSLSSKLGLIAAVRDHHRAVPVLLLDQDGTLERRELPVSDPLKILDTAEAPSEIIAALEKFIGVEDPL